MTCNSVQLSSRFICLSRFLKPNDKKSYEKHLITIDHKHNLYINFRFYIRITYFHNAKPLIFNLFSLRFQAHLLKSCLYNLKNNTIPIQAQTIMLFDKYVWL